jgi:hypothetical protein
VVGIKHNNRKTTRIRGGSRRRTSSSTQEQMDVVTRDARTALDRRMSRAIIAVHTSRLPWCHSNLVPRAVSLLLARRGAPLALWPWECRRFRAPGTPPLARTGAPPSLALQIREPLPPCHQPGNHHHYSGSRSHRHRTFGSGSPSHHNPWSGVHRCACSRATTAVARALLCVIANELGWGMKN